MDSFAKRLKVLRESHGLSVSDLSRKIGVGRQTICNWEDGRQKPSGINLRKLSLALDVVDIEWELDDQTKGLARAMDEARKSVAAAAGVPLEKVTIKIKRL